MQCINCRRELKETDMFCPVCGASNVNFNNTDKNKPDISKKTILDSLLLILGVFLVVVGIFFYKKASVDTSHMFLTHEQTLELATKSGNLQSDFIIITAVGFLIILYWILKK